MKQIIVFLAVLMGCVTIGNSQDGDHGVPTRSGGGVQGHYYDMGCSLSTGKCKGQSDCCENEYNSTTGKTNELLCYIDGKCGIKNETVVYEEGVEVVVGVVGAWVLYDRCGKYTKRVDEECTKDSDCCEPLLCNWRKRCTAFPDLISFLAVLRGF